MSANTHTTETTERKPPTIADIVREKTGDGALIIDFFTDVMTGRIEGAQLCHRIDAAKQLVKYGSKDAAEFIAKYKGVPCGHSTRGRPNQADPCSDEERSLVAVTLNAPPTLTRDFLTVLSGIDEFLMARLIRAQTADGVTVIEFLDDVMQDRTDGFKTHHRIAAAKELIVHIVRDEQPSHTPSPPTEERRSEGDTPAVGADPRVPPLPGSQTPAPSTRETDKRGDTPAVGADPRVRPLPGSQTPAPSTRETDKRGDTPAVGADPRVRPLPGSQTPAPSTRETDKRGDSTVVGADPRVRPLPGSHTPAPSTRETDKRGDSTVVGPDPRVRPLPGSQTPSPLTGEGWGEGDSNVAAEKSEPAPELPGADTQPPNPEHDELAEGSLLETNNSKTETLPARRPRTRRTRTQRRRDGNARAAIRRKALGSERIEEEKDENPAPAELTIAERRINEKLKQHWHEPDPWAGPIDSTHPGRSPPW